MLKFLLEDQSILTKDQMKKIAGGMGCGVTGDGGRDLGLVDCTGGNACTCQDEYDAACEQVELCDDVDCGCK